MPELCIICKKTSSNNDGVVCDIGRHSIHITCAGISRQEADCLKSAKRKINFFCENCNIMEIVTALKTEVPITIKGEIRNYGKEIGRSGYKSRWKKVI